MYHLSLLDNLIYAVEKKNSWLGFRGQTQSQSSSGPFFFLTQKQNEQFLESETWQKLRTALLACRTNCVSKNKANTVRTGGQWRCFPHWLTCTLLLSFLRRACLSGFLCYIVCSLRCSMAFFLALLCAVLFYFKKFNHVFFIVSFFHSLCCSSLLGFLYAFLYFLNFFLILFSFFLQTFILLLSSFLLFIQSFFKYPFSSFLSSFFFFLSFHYWFLCLRLSFSILQTFEESSHYDNNHS